MLKHQKLVDEAMDYLRETARNINNFAFQTFALEVLDDPAFATAWGSSSETKHHHAFRGGLACHTAEVLRFALGATNLHRSDIDLALLKAAAITHDYGKILDYDDAGRKTSFYKLVRHVVYAPAMFMQMFPRELDDRDQNLIHTLLAHHGRKEWGSPVEPQTIEAHILHYADMMSVKFGATKDLTEDGETQQDTKG